jgi:hypothetical protein
MPPRWYHSPVSEPSFNQEQPRSLVVPALVAIVLLGAVFLIARHFLPPSSARAEYLHTGVLETATVMHANTIVLGANETDYALFVATTIKVDNPTANQISLDDFILTITDPTGATLTEKAVRKQDLAESVATFPKLKPLVGTPLWRDTAIDPGQSAQGTLVFSFAVPQTVWDTRKSAELEVDVYHGHSLTLTIPK